MASIRWARTAILLGALVGFAVPVAADSVHLGNGDVLNGRVLGLDDKQLRLESDTLGQISIPRDKVVSITLGDSKAAVPASAAKKGAAPAGGVEGILKQLQTTGVNPKDVGDIQNMLPLLANPEASKYFNDTLKGLMGGTLSVGDVRKEAMRARDELKKATKGLGPDVEAGLAPYLRILENFIDETKPARPPAAPRKESPTPSK